MLRTGQTVVGLTVAMVGRLVCAEVPRVGSASTVSGGAIGAFSDGEFRYSSRGF